MQEARSHAGKKRKRGAQKEKEKGGGGGGGGKKTHLDAATSTELEKTENLHLLYLLSSVLYSF